MNARIGEHGPEADRHLTPIIDEASTGRTIAFLAGDEAAAKATALAAMDAIDASDGARNRVADLDLQGGSASLDLAFDEVGPLKTDVEFTRLKSGPHVGAWVVGVDKVHSETTSLRSRVEAAVGRRSLPASASVGFRFADPQEGLQYLDLLGLPRDEAVFSRQAQEKAFRSLTFGLRNAVGGYDERTPNAAQEWTVNRPEDMIAPVMAIVSGLEEPAQQAFSRALFKKVMWFADGNPEHSGEYYGISTTQGMIARTYQLARDMPDKTPALYLGDLTDGLFQLYELLKGQPKKQDDLYNRIFAATARRYAELGRHLPETMPFDYDQSAPLFSSGDMTTTVAVPSNDSRLEVGLAMWLKGSFNLKKRTFAVDDGVPYHFAVRVRPAPDFELSNDRHLQPAINATASVLALQHPTFLDMRLSTRADTSHLEPRATLVRGMLASQHPAVRQLGTRLLDIADRTAPAPED